VYDSPTGIGSINLDAHNVAPPPQFLALSCGLVSLVPLVTTPDFLCADLDLVHNAFRVQFALTSVKHVEYRKVVTTPLLGGTPQESEVLDLAVGGGNTFKASVDATLNATTEARIFALLSNIPATVHLQTGPEIHYRASDNFDLTVDATFGDPRAFASIPTPPTYALGLALRDGTNGTAEAMRAVVHLTGVPTSIDLDINLPGIINTGQSVFFDATGWRPASKQLIVDVNMDTFLPKQVYAWAEVENVVPTIGATQDVHFSYTHLISLFGSPTDKITWATTSNIGPVVARAIYGTDQVYLDLSTIPRAMNFSAQLGTTTSPDTTIHYNASNAISSLFIGFDVHSVPVATFQGSLDITQIPASWDMTIGHNSVGPTLTYTASASTLDADVALKAALFGDVTGKAQVLAGFTNLGASAKAQLTSGATSQKKVPDTSTPDPCDTKTVAQTDPDGIQVTSTPATSYLYMTVSASVTASHSDSGTLCFSAIVDWRVPWSYNLNVNADVKQLRVELNDVSSMTVKPGLPSKVTGTYNRLIFGWDSVTFSLRVTASAKLQGCINTIFGPACTDIPGISASIDKNLSGQVDVWFHRSSLGFGPWLDIDACGITGPIDLKPHGSSTQFDQVFTYGTGSTLGAGSSKWYVLPDLDNSGSPFLPGWLGAAVIAILADSGDAGVDA
jgi:hypothetical protein